MNFGLFSDGFHPATRLARLYEPWPGAEERWGWQENQQRKGIWSKTGEATLMQHWLQNWAIIECQKSSAQCIHGWLTRQIARGHTANRKPIFRSRDHYPPIRWESYSSKSEQVDQELIPTFIVRAMEMSLSFPSTNSSCICKSDSATTTSIFQFIRNIIFHLSLFSPRQARLGWMHLGNVMLKIFKSVRESVRVLCCLF